MEYCPDKWVIVKLCSERFGFIYKVLAGWSGGFTTEDSWKLNSGIEEIVVDGDIYKFYGYSGSVYVCNKHAYGLTSLTSDVFENFKQTLSKKGDTIEVVSLEDYIAG